MHVALTGVPGVGKTTLALAVAQALGHHEVTVRGFYTEERRESRNASSISHGGGGSSSGGGGNRIGFDVVDFHSGHRVPLASKETNGNANCRPGPKVGSYRVFVEDFERFSVPILKEAIEANAGVILIDEIGEFFKDLGGFLLLIWQQ